MSQPSVEILARIQDWLRSRHATVGVAESLTGGLLCAALTQTPGASLTIRGGLVVYATDLKTALAGVDARLLATRGAVDPDVALALARGARTRLRATYGLGVTGVAGPDPQDGQAVGTVFGALSGPHGERVCSWLLAGGRAEIRAGAVTRCLDLLVTEFDRAP